MNRILVILISSLILCSCKLQSGSICVYEEGINDCLTKYEYTDANEADKFILFGTILSFPDSLPVAGAWLLWQGLENKGIVDQKGKFSVEMDYKEEIELVIMGEYSSSQIKIYPEMGKKLEIELFLGVSSAWSTYHSDNMRELRKAIKKENRNKQRFNKKVKKINERISPDLALRPIEGKK